MYSVYAHRLSEIESKSAENKCKRSISNLKPYAARTGRTVFSQLSAAIVRHKANEGVVYALRAWFKYDTALSAVV